MDCGAGRRDQTEAPKPCRALRLALLLPHKNPAGPLPALHVDKGADFLGGAAATGAPPPPPPGHRGVVWLAAPPPAWSLPGCQDPPRLLACTHLPPHPTMSVNCTLGLSRVCLPQVFHSQLQDLRLLHFRILQSL